MSGGTPINLNKEHRPQVIDYCLGVMDEYDSDEMEHVVALYTLYNIIMYSGMKDQLGQLVDDGPIWDGNVISKSERDQLVEWGLACRVMVGGEDGYTAANYKGRHVLWTGAEIAHDFGR